MYGVSCGFYVIIHNSVSDGHQQYARSETHREPTPFYRSTDQTERLFLYGCLDVM